VRDYVLRIESGTIERVLRDGSVSAFDFKTGEKIKDVKTGKECEGVGVSVFTRRRRDAGPSRGAEQPRRRDLLASPTAVVGQPLSRSRAIDRVLS
jgi:hypothetical protein